MPGRNGERHRNQGHLANVLALLRESGQVVLAQKLLELWEGALALAQNERGCCLDEARIDRVSLRVDQLLATSEERRPDERDRLRDWLARFCRELRLANREAGYEGVEQKTRTRLNRLLKQGGAPADPFTPEREPRALQALLEDLVA